MAAGTMVALLGELAFWSHPLMPGGLRLAAVGGFLVLVQALPLAVAARWTLSTLALSASAMLVYEAFGFTQTYVAFAPLVIVVMAFAMRRPWRAAVVTGLYALGIALWDLSQASHPLVWVVATVGIIPIAALAGLGLRAYRSREEAERAARELRATASRTAERLALARHLHDSVGHGLTLATLRAEAASQVLVEDPVRVKELLAGVADSGRQAVMDLQELVGLLRDAAEIPESEETLDVLARRFSSAELDVVVERRGNPIALSSEAEVACRRIVSEGLANIVRHAKARHGTVRLDYGSQALHVEVADDGCGPDAGHVDGYGLRGASERARAIGCGLRFEARSGGGALLSAVIPYAQASP